MLTLASIAIGFMIISAIMMLILAWSRMRIAKEWKKALDKIDELQQELLDRKNSSNEKQ